MPPLPNPFIIFCISLNCLRSALTSEVAVPLPLAMRTRRAPSMMAGSVRSLGVIELDDGLDLADLAVVDLRRGLLQVLRHPRA